MSDVRRTRWNWKFVVALIVAGGFCLASLVSLIVNFDHVEPWTKYLAQASLVATAVFWLLGWFPNGSGRALWRRTSTK
ncbi:hypothetical protein ACWDUL_27680 [Nocardia niigatensis]|uniref:hypothetical protein n=1 Tax=Nocardia niigatensis TaxID=209249 RepID=UPI0002F48647|nr:hypothetical protein [Nocardia niigatensis]